MKDTGVKIYICLYSFHRYDKTATFLEQYLIIEEENIKYYNLWNHVFSTGELQENLEEGSFDKYEFYNDVLYLEKIIQKKAM